MNRTAEMPLDVDILADVCLPITVDKVEAWSEPSAVIEMAAQGVLLSSPTDASRAWPEVWPTERAAEWALKGLKEITGRVESPDAPSALPPLADRLLRRKKVAAPQRFASGRLADRTP